MTVDKTEKYWLLKPTDETVIECFNLLRENYADYIGKHLIIDFSEKINVKIEELVLFLNLSVDHNRSGTSFVLVSKGINIDEIPEEISIVPTINEAKDILEMDAIERDLGF